MTYTPPLDTPLTPCALNAELYTGDGSIGSKESYRDAARACLKCSCYWPCRESAQQYVKYSCVQGGIVFRVTIRQKLYVTFDAESECRH